jgi:hypothetical protein
MKPAISDPLAKTHKLSLDAVPYLATALLISACAVWITRKALYSESLDVGNHYAVTEYISRYGAWPPTRSPVRPWDDYPLLAHTMAAFAGRAIGSNLRALLALSVLSTCAIYAVLGWGTRRFGLSGWIFSLSAGGLMMLFSYLNIFWGSEVITNFFYAQIVGEAGYLAFLLLISNLRDWSVKAVVGCAGTYVLVHVYTLSAVHLALSCPLLWAVHFLQSWQINRRLPFRELAFGALLLSILIILVAANDTFSSMVANAGHGARIDVLGNGGFVGIVFANLLLLAALAFMSINNKSGLMNPDFVLAALGGVTGAALIQWLTREVFGYGAPYALSKHTFALGSMFVVAAATVALDMFFALSRSRHAARNINFGGSVLAPALFMTLALLSLWWGRPRIDLTTVEAFDNDARKLAAGEIGKTVVGQTVAFHSRFSEGINFAVALADLGVSEHNRVEQVSIYSGKLRPEEQTAAYFVVSPNQMTTLHPDCRVLNIPPLKVSILVHARCYDQVIQ